MSSDPKTAAMEHRLDVLQEQLNLERRANEKLAKELAEAKLTIATQAEDIFLLEALGEGVPVFYPPLARSAYVPMPEWDNRGWSVSA